MKTMDNGLVVLASRTPAQGIVTVDVKVLAGSSREGRYLGSGISHLVEHMLFKGTATRGPGTIEREVRSLGGVMNGSVSPDLADYHITLPAENLPQALAILKDMLLNAVFDPAETDREREVIAKEIRMNEDEPQSRLMQFLHDTAYRVHPYKQPTIGHEPMLRALTRDDIVRFYTTAYVPNRMAVGVAGDIDPATAISAVEREFSAFRPPDLAPFSELPREPLQLDRRLRSEPTETTLGYLALGFHSTEIASNDLYALDVAALILGRGDTSRLNTALYKNKRLVHMISAWNDTPRDPGLFIIAAITDPALLDRASRAALDEIERLKRGPITDDELETARRTVLADHIYNRETTDGVADDLTTDYLLTGSPAFSRRYIAGIGSVTKDDVRRVVTAYLTPDRLTEVRLAPREAVTPEARAAEPAGNVFDRMTLDNGLRVLLRRNVATPSAAVTVAMLGGTMDETPGTNGLSSMVSRMLFKGTKTRSERELIGAIQRMGGTADSFSGISTFGFTIKCLSGDVPRVLAIAKDALANPTFPDAELEQEKRFTIAKIREEDDDIFDTGFAAVRRDLYPGSPYGMRYLGEERSVAAITRQRVVSFHAAHCVPGSMVIAVSGDIDLQAIRTECMKLFGDLHGTASTVPAPAPATARAASARSIPMDKEEALVLVGFRTVPLADPDRYAIDVAGSLLSGQSGRMFLEMRDRMSLAYALGCAQKFSLKTGYFAFYVATAPDKVGDVRKELLSQIAAVRTGRASADELELAKRELLMRHRIDLQSNEYVASNGALEELCGTGSDAIFTYDRAIGSVSADDVARACERYLDPGLAAEITIIPR